MDATRAFREWEAAQDRSGAGRFTVGQRVRIQGTYRHGQVGTVVRADRTYSVDLPGVGVREYEACDLLDMHANNGD